MRALSIAIVVLACACGKEAPRKLNHFESFERAFADYSRFLEKIAAQRGELIPQKNRERTYRAVYIGPPGVFVDRKLVATLADLETRRAVIAAAIDANAKMLPTIEWKPSVTIELRDEPARVAISALRLFAGRDMDFYRRVYADPEGPPRPLELLCASRLRAEPTTDKTRENISILFDPDKIWLGISRIDEFYVLPDTPAGRDFEKLELTLKGQKSSAAFAERRDLELGVNAGTSLDVLTAFELACKTGFPDVAILPPDQLSAVPQL